MDFLKFFVISFSWRYFKQKLILLLIFHHKFHIWQNSGFQVMGQNAVNQSNCAISNCANIALNLIKEVNDEVYCWHADKHRSSLQVKTIILGMRSQTCPKYPK